MKKILITLDFSQNSIDAANAILPIAKILDAELHFLHMFTLPYVNAEMPTIIDFEAYQEIKEKRLNSLVEGIEYPIKKTKASCISGLSFASVVEEYCAIHQIELIVMGLTGASVMEELFLGSNSLNLISSSKVPVLAIPLGYKFPSAIKIGFAYDGKQFSTKDKLHTLVQLALSLNTKIHAFHVSKTAVKLDIYNKLKTEIPFEDFDLTIKDNEDVEVGILEYITNNDISMLGIVPRKHNFFDRLFHRGFTKDIANYASIPLLSVPD
jgi:nucleotide-binding universal stress UspA family protein